MSLNRSFGRRVEENENPAPFQPAFPDIFDFDNQQNEEDMAQNADDDINNNDIPQPYVNQADEDIDDDNRIPQPQENQVENEFEANVEPEIELRDQEEDSLPQEDFQRLIPPVAHEYKPSLIPEKPFCPITLVPLTSETKVLGAPDGQVYEESAINQWLQESTRSPVIPTMIFGPHRLFNPVAFREATQYAEYKDAKYQRLKEKYKLKKIEKAGLSTQVDELKQENQKLLAEKQKLESKLKRLNHESKLFKTHVKRKAHELIETIEQQTPKNAKRKLR